MINYCLKLVVLFAVFTASQATAADAVWIDVRTAEEYESGHLPDAHNIPHDAIAAGIEALVPDKSKPIKVYCGSGRRAGLALQTLESLGYTAVSNEGSYRDLAAGD